ncbi:ectomycorrhiza-upregulated zf-MYND domain-containing protein [Pyrenophora tritici-repentis]|nr:hypothetical protein A1F99_141830 [Pyrenophora tritici-repentis]KAF7451083.1 hypothetical protein A1F99_056990 [Pyrenophora tritici-repentis]KAI0578242.1 hypothetical protein Alg215_06434 [Pyrenophora tritici-repentis]KAI1537834.1 ectomycorrhiza-upregulated zf-MYND domain-containing protein [Pyrenophora tritici-repentis]KAI1540228.1 ectomycorrhiza-upregulated zf-MYND domain-containing protein [Pyrenophora tritici-repentis]
MSEAARKLASLSRKAETAASRFTGDTVQAVQIGCKKESGGFWNVNIASDHPIFDTKLLEVPAMLEIPLVICPLGTKSNNPADLDCPLAASLCISYAEGVHMYIESLLDTYGEDGPEAAHEEISKEEFEEWFESYKETEAENGSAN